MPISAHTIAEIKRLTHLPEVVGEYVKLRQMGQRFSGLCPFHNEKTPSLSVHPEFYVCFGCGEKGDAFKFLMKIEGISFAVAAEQLAARAGVSIDAKPISRAVMSAAKEDIALSAWWWKQRREATAANVSNAVEDCDDSLAETLGNMLRWIDAMKPADRLNYCLCHVTGEDRAEYRRAIAAQQILDDVMSGMTVFDWIRERLARGVRIAALSGYKDPDDYIKKYGADSYRHAVETANKIPEFEL